MRIQEGLTWIGAQFTIKLIAYIIEICTANGMNSPVLDPGVDSSTNQIYAAIEEMRNHIISYGSLSELDVTVVYLQICNQIQTYVTGKIARAST